MNPSSLILLAGLVIGVALAGCDRIMGKPSPRATRDFSQPSGPPKVSAAMPLAYGAQAHVIDVPIAWGELAQCVAVVGTGGAVAVSCLPKGIDLPPLEETK